MSKKSFELDDLERILLEGAGAAEDIAFDADIMDTEFEALAYDSVALLETASRIEREYGLTLDDSDVADAKTPRALIDLVNSQLGAVAKA